MTPWVHSPWNSPGLTGVGSISLLQGVFPTQGSNPGLPYCRLILYQLSHKRRPRENWSGEPIPSPADIPDAGIEPGSPALQVDSLPTEPEAAILVFSFEVMPLQITQRLRTHIYYHINHRNQEATGGSFTPFKLVPCVLVIQSCPTLCDLMDCSPSGSSVHGILQARILEWVAMPSSRGSS